MSDDWRSVPARQVARIEIGGTPAREEPRFWANQDSGRPWASIADLNADEVVETAEYISDLGVRSSNVKLVPAGTPIMSFKLTIGRTSIAGRDLYTNEAIAAFFCDSREVDRRYLFHVLPRAAGSVITDVAIKGATLNKKSLASMLLPLPQLPEQRRIAQILNTIDDQLRATVKILTVMDAARAGLVADLMSNGIDQTGALREQGKNPRAFRDSAVGYVPVEWDVAPLASRKAASRPHLKTGPFGSSLKQEHWVDDGVPVVTIGSLGAGKFIESELLYVSEQTANALSAYALSAGDIVFSRVADVGRSAVVTERERGWIMSSNMMWISLDSRIADPHFVQANIAGNPWVRRQIRQYVNSAGRDVANAKVMNLLRFPWPPIDEQKAIAERIARFDQQVLVEQARLMKLRALKAGLSDDILTSRVRVHGAVL